MGRQGHEGAVCGRSEPVGNTEHEEEGCLAPGHVMLPDSAVTHGYVVQGTRHPQTPSSSPRSARKKLQK